MERAAAKKLSKCDVITANLFLITKAKEVGVKIVNYIFVVKNVAQSL